jgi:hypothetical protein
VPSAPLSYDEIASDYVDPFVTVETCFDSHVSHMSRTDTGSVPLVQALVPIERTDMLQ